VEQVSSSLMVNEIQLSLSEQRTALSLVRTAIVKASTANRETSY